MFFDFLTLKPEVFGIDISDYSLRIAKLEKRGQGLALVSFGEAVIEPGIVERGEIKNEDALAEIIKKTVAAIGGKKIQTNYIVASLPEEKSFVQVIQLPLMNEEEIKKSVHFEAENYIPIPIDKVYLDSQIIPSPGDIKHSDVLIAAVPKSIVDSYVSVLKRAHLRPLALEVESQAVSRVLIKNGQISETVLMLDLGGAATTFIIFSGASPRFTTSLPAFSRIFTENISRVLGVSFKEAEMLKLKYGLLLAGNKPTESEIKVFEAITPALADLLEQIKKYLDYYQTSPSHEHSSVPTRNGGVKKIILCGGGANLKGLDHFLSQELKVPVILADPLANILPRSPHETPPLSYRESLKYTVAIGLALRGTTP